MNFPSDSRLSKRMERLTGREELETKNRIKSRVRRRFESLFRNRDDLKKRDLSLYCVFAYTTVVDSVNHLNVNLKFFPPVEVSC